MEVILLMHLRSCSFIKSKNKSVRDLARRISLEESVKQRVGLETIFEDTFDMLPTMIQSTMALQGSH